MVYPLSHDELLPAFRSRHSVQQRCIASCVAFPPLGAQHRELGQGHLVLIYRGLVHSIQRLPVFPPSLLVLLYCYQRQALW